MWFYMKYIALNRGWRILMAIDCTCICLPTCSRRR